MQEIKLIRGDSAIIEFSIEEEIDWDSIQTLILTAKPYPSGNILFQKNKEDFTKEENIYSVELLPEDTQELTCSNFVFDIEITLNDRTRGTLLGKISLEKDITTHTVGDIDET